MLKAESDVSTIRAYAHCSAVPPRTRGDVRDRTSSTGSDGAGMTVLLLNLDPTMHVNVSLNIGATMPYERTEWHLSGPGGANGTSIALNNVTLKVDVEGGRAILPPLAAKPMEVGVADPVQLAPASIAFVQVNDAVAIAGCSQL